MPATSTRAKRRNQLTFHDRLSRLTYTKVCKLLGTGAERLLTRGGAYDFDDLAQAVTIGPDRLRISVPGGAVVTIKHTDSRPHGLAWRCSACGHTCDHVGAAFSLVLEEKTLLGLARRPGERKVLENLPESELVAHAYA